MYHPFWNDSKADEDAVTCITDVIDFGYIKYGADCKFIVCGDFNDLHKSYSTIRNLTQLIPLVDFPTRDSNILDQIFTNFVSKSKPTRLPPLGRSDHSCVFWKSSSSPFPVVAKRVIRKFSHSSISKFHSLVAEQDWLGTIAQIPDLDCAFSCFTSLLSSIFTKCFPTRTIRIRSSDPEWFQLSLKILIDDRDRAYSEGKLHKYKRLRNEVILHIQKLKEVFISKVSSKENSKKTWQTLRSFGRLSRCNSDSSIKFSASDFSDYFASNFQLDKDSSNFSLDCLSSAAIIPELTCAEVTDFLSKLRNRGTGSDGLPSWIFKDCAFIFAPVLTFLFNRSLLLGCFPNSLKLANVTPIPKCASPSSIADFRPISILPVLSKLFERMVLKKWIFPFVKDRVDTNQFAYIPREGSGTTCALVSLQNKILQFLDSPGAVRVLSIDFRKAFDKLSYSSIFDALFKFDINPYIITWISSFLSSRSQRVSLKGEFSEVVSITSGVPQGSVLGPVLFVLVMDGLSVVCTNTSVIKYADDVTFLHCIRNQSDDCLQQEWDSLVDWADSVQLPINFDKCCVLDFITKRSIQLHPICRSSSLCLKQVSSFRFLGVEVSGDFKWNNHFDFVLRKASRRLFVLRNLRRSGCPSHLLFKAYSGFIRPLLTYSFPSFCNAPQYLMNRFLSFERRAFRIIGWDHSSQFSVIHTGERQCSKLFESIEASRTHPLRSMFLEKAPSSTRSSLSLRRPRSKTKRFLESFVKFCN